MKEEMDERRSFSPVGTGKEELGASRGRPERGIHRESERIWVEVYSPSVF